MDVWASLQIYLTLSKMTVSIPLDFNSILPPELDVFVYQEDRSRIIARGQISVHSDYKSLDGITITKTHILVDITEIYVPGAVITAHHG